MTAALMYVFGIAWEKVVLSPFSQINDVSLSQSQTFQSLTINFYKFI
jgi:hypothetical protein